MAAPRKRRKRASKQALWLDDYPLYYMTHIVTESQRKIQDAIRPLKITPNEWRVLFFVHDHDDLSISDIAEECLIEPSTLSRLLKALEKRELIERIRDDEDQRYTRIVLTNKGQEAYKNIIPVVSRQLEFTQSGLSESDKKTLLRILKSMKTSVYRSPFAVGA